MSIVSNDNYNISPAPQRRISNVSLAFRHRFASALRLKNTYLVLLKAARIELLLSVLSCSVSRYRIYKNNTLESSSNVLFIR